MQDSRKDQQFLIWAWLSLLEIIIILGTAFSLRDRVRGSIDMCPSAECGSEVTLRTIILFAGLAILLRFARKLLERILVDKLVRRL